MSKVIQTGVLQQTLNQSVLTNYLKATSTAIDSAALGGLPPSDYTQGQAKIVSGQVTNTTSLNQTVLTVAGLLHVSALWWPSDGTAQFTIVNDSGGTLDFGGDFPGLPYEDTIPTGTTQLGTLQQSSAADGTIAPAVPRVSRSRRALRLATSRPSRSPTELMSRSRSQRRARSWSRSI